MQQSKTAILAYQESALVVLISAELDNTVLPLPTLCMSVQYEVVRGVEGALGRSELHNAFLKLRVIKGVSNVFIQS